MVRLTLAETTGPQWGQSFSYDGFGNMTSEVATKGIAPTTNHIYDAATNRLLPTSDYTYDANGNLTAMPGLGMTYNAENRLVQAVSNLNGTESYGYDQSGLRLWKQASGGPMHVFFNGGDGKPLADFYFDSGLQAVRGGAPMVYFAGKRVDNGSVEDRLGTGVVEGQNRMAYFPYGELRSGSSTEVQFASYKRDSVSNLDYARQRYFSSQIARFTTADPKDGSARPEIPQSWNRYTYALGDPINKTDPNGEDWMGEQGSYGSYGSMGFFGGGHSSSWASFGFCCNERMDGMSMAPDLSAGFGPGYMGGGGGGGGGGDTGQVAQQESIDLIKMHSRCAGTLGMDDSEGLAGLLKDEVTVSMKNLGTETLDAEGKPTVEAGYSPGGTIDPLSGTWQPSPDKSITLNSAINWADPNSTAAVDADGQPTTYRFLDAVASELGAPGITPAQVMELVILHELSHLLGRDHDGLGLPSQKDFDTAIWNDCFN